MKNIYIIEDDEIVRNLLSTYLSEIIPDHNIVGISEDGVEAKDDCVRLNPDLVILDLYLPVINGLEILHFLKRRMPDTKVIIFSGIAEKRIYDIAVEGKADGYVVKTSGFEEFYHAVKTVSEGDTYFSSELQNPGLSTAVS